MTQKMIFGNHVKAGNMVSSIHELILDTLIDFFKKNQIDLKFYDEQCEDYHILVKTTKPTKHPNKIKVRVKLNGKEEFIYACDISVSSAHSHTDAYILKKLKEDLSLKEQKIISLFSKEILATQC